MTHRAFPREIRPLYAQAIFPSASATINLGESVPLWDHRQSNTQPKDDWVACRYCRRLSSKGPSCSFCGANEMWIANGTESDT